MKFESDIYDEWSAEINLGQASWLHRKEAKSKDGSLQEGWFWRHRGRLSDEKLIKDGVLKEIPNQGIYHIAHIPWRFSDGSAGKSDWDEEEWKFLRKVIEDTFNQSRGNASAFEFKFMTLERDSISLFKGQSIRECHIIGEIHRSHLNNDKIHGCFVSGNVVEFSNIFRCFIDGVIECRDRSVSIDGVKARSLIVNSSNQSQDHSIFIDECEIEDVYIHGSFTDLYTNDLVGNKLDISDSSFAHGGFSGEASRFLLNAENCYFDKRVVFKDLSLSRDISNKSNFRHALFSDKVIFNNVEIFISCLSDIQLGGPIDLDIKDYTLEQAFSKELMQMRTLRSDVYFEILRSSLESSCQIICERNRQDGRKDLEKRFRRMELISRSASKYLEPSTKFINWFYRVFSDFGASWWRPLLGIAASWLFFGLIYLLIACLKFDAFGEVGAPPNIGLLTDVALLTVDKSFPVGVSVNEAKLFDGALVGEGGGVSAIAIGVIGAIQTIFSGILIFLAGLAVRNRLLIG